MCSPTNTSIPRPTRRVISSVRRGFTLLEILVVLAILGLIAGLAISKIDTIFGGAKIQAAELFVKTTLKTPLTTYQIRMGDYPSTAEGIQALITAPSGKGDKWPAPFIEGNSVPLDPWKQPYQYAYPGTHNKGGYDLWSKGPDGQSGTADDIGNWDSAPTETK